MHVANALHRGNCKSVGDWQARTSDAKARACKIHFFREAHLRVEDGVQPGQILDLLLFSNCLQPQKHPREIWLTRRQVCNGCE